MKTTKQPASLASIKQGFSDSLDAAIQEALVLNQLVTKLLELKMVDSRFISELDKRQKSFQSAMFGE